MPSQGGTRDGGRAAAPWASGQSSVQSVRVRPRSVGRCRVALRYKRLGLAPGVPPGIASRPFTQYVHYHVLDPARTLLQRYGNFSSAHHPHGAYLPRGVADPWHRAPAFMGTDAESGTALLEEARVFMAGLSDESGAAASLAIAMKQLGLPVRVATTSPRQRGAGRPDRQLDRQPAP